MERNAKTKESGKGGKTGARKKAPASGKRAARAERTKPAAEPARAAEPAAEAPAGEAGAEGGGEGGEPAVGQSLRRVRMARGMSLEALARVSGVSRAMLSQIELGHSMPTIKVLWKVARSLGLPFSALLSEEKSEAATTVLRADRARRLTSHDGRFSSRALFPPDRPRRVEFYELRLAPGGHEEAEAHAPGTIENLVVHRGTVEITASGASHKLSAGDAIQFQADGPHAYKNEGASEAIMYLVMSYPEAVASPGWNV